MIKVEFTIANDELLNAGFQFDLPLKEIAEEVKKNVVKDLTTPKSYDGSGLKPLKPNYAALKRKKLGHDRIFDAFRKGKEKLINSITVKKISNREYWVIPGTVKNEMIMDKLTKDGRKGFGITDSSLDKIVQYIIDKFKL